MREINAPELAKEIATGIFKLAEMQFEMTGRDARRFRALVKSICRDMAEKVEDEQLRSFLQEDSWFKPSPETLHLQAAAKAFDDPEMQKKMQEAGERMMEGHNHDHDH